MKRAGLGSRRGSGVTGDGGKRRSTRSVADTYVIPSMTGTLGLRGGYP